MVNRSNFNESINEIETEPFSTFDKKESQNSIQVAEAFDMSQKLSCWQKFPQLKLRYQVFSLMCILLITLASIAAILFALYGKCLFNPCMHGYCSLNQLDDFECTCEQGWVGEKCDFDCKSTPNQMDLDGVCYIFIKVKKNYDDAILSCKNQS